jgi:hypothetical protein
MVCVAAAGAFFRHEIAHICCSLKGVFLVVFLLSGDCRAVTFFGCKNRLMEIVEWTAKNPSNLHKSQSDGIDCSAPQGCKLVEKQGLERFCMLSKMSEQYRCSCAPHDPSE